MRGYIIGPRLPLVIDTTGELKHFLQRLQAMTITPAELQERLARLDEALAQYKPSPDDKMIIIDSLH